MMQGSSRRFKTRIPVATSSGIIQGVNQDYPATHGAGYLDGLHESVL